MTQNWKKHRFGCLVGANASMRKVFSFIEKSAKADLPVLIIGETGTGKDLVAQEIHARSKRRIHPFVAVNMGALPKELINSELFGHAKGSFTGATEAKMGRFAEAKKGTLFLDEISTMDENAQVALLRVLETKKFRQIGGKRDISTHVRIIAATNIEPRRGVRQRVFRHDLLQRLQVLRIALPPLRKRKSDIKFLAPYFLEIFEKEFGTHVSGITKDTLQLLREYNWPGNVRELKNVIAQAAVMAENGIIGPEHLPSRICSLSEQQDEIHETGVPDLTGNNLSPANPILSSNDSPLSLVATDGVFFPLGLSLDEVEKTYVLKTLANCGNNKTLAANRLGISRKALYDKLERWGIQV